MRSCPGRPTDSFRSWVMSVTTHSWWERKFDKIIDYIGVLLSRRTYCTPIWKKGRLLSFILYDTQNEIRDKTSFRRCHVTNVTKYMPIRRRTHRQKQISHYLFCIYFCDSIFLPIPTIESRLLPILEYVPLNGANAVATRYRSVTTHLSSLVLIFLLIESHWLAFAYCSSSSKKPCSGTAATCKYESASIPPPPIDGTCHFSSPGNGQPCHYEYCAMPS